MIWELAQDIIFDALKDSVLVFAFVFLIHILLSFFENRIVYFLTKNRKTSVLFGSLFGIIPQCGTSVVAADLYIKRFITIGTLIAVFLSCSDEALLILLSAWNEKTLAIFPLIGLKLVAGVAFGLLIDLIIRKQKVEEVDRVEEEKECHHHHHENTPAHAHLIHPLIHSIEIFAYVLVINLALGLLIGFVGVDNFSNFMISNRYLAPLFTSIIGLIPNCASSVAITELYLSGTLSFGALFAGLLVNSGLGMMVLFKEYKNIKKTLLILGLCFVIAVSLGYLTCLVSGF